MKIIHDERFDHKHSGFSPKRKLILSIAGLATIIGSSFYLNQKINGSWYSFSNNISKPGLEMNLKQTENKTLDSIYSKISDIQDLDDFGQNPQDSMQIDTLKNYEITNFGRFYLGKSSSLNSQILLKDVDNDGREDFIRYDPYSDILEVYKNKIVTKNN